MWDSARQQHLDDLQRRVEHEPPSADDLRSLEELLHELEEAEWASLRPAEERSRRERDVLATELSEVRAQNAAVAALADRYADLFVRARLQLATLTSEREVLRREYQRAAR